MARTARIRRFSPIFRAVERAGACVPEAVTLSIDVVRENTAEARKAMTGMNELVVSGTLEYQACDDKICYNCLIRRSPQPPCTILLNRCFDQDVNFTTNVSQRIDRKTSSARARIRL